MPKKPQRQPMPPRPPLALPQILAWAEAHHAHTGEWPKTSSGPVVAEPSEKWLNVNMALRLGLRGLPGGDSLARLLERERGVTNSKALPMLTEEKICRWAEAHCRQTESWPNENSGPVQAAPGETWDVVNAALREGLRGLPGGDTLAQLLARRLGVRNRTSAPPLTEGQIRFWAVDHERRTGRRPNAWSGPVLAAPGETWRLLDGYLRAGRRGLPGGSSLAGLLAGRSGAKARRGGRRNEDASMPDWSPFLVGAAVLAVFWAMLAYGVLTGRLWRRGGSVIRRDREPGLFLLHAVVLAAMGLLASGALVWVSVTMGPGRQ